MRLSRSVLALALGAALLAPATADAQRRSSPRPAQAAAVAVPAGTYALDPAHTNFNFSVQHMGLAEVTGAFAQTSGTITVGSGGLRTLEATATAQTASIDTRVEMRDNHLKSADFFDAATHPTVTFQSTGVRNVRGDRFQLLGTLTMRGVSRPVVLDAQYRGTAVQPAQMGGKRLVGFSARGTVNRLDYGISYGPDMIGQTVQIVINAEAVQQ